MILILDTFCGLCNQMMDIRASIAFCEHYDLPFTFRYATFREKDNLTAWYNVPFTDLFDDDFLKKSPKNLYIEYGSISGDIRPENTFNYESVQMIQLINNENKNNENACNDKTYQKIKNISLNENIKYKYFVAKQFWPIYDWSLPVNNDILLPNKKLFAIYNSIKKDLLSSNRNRNHNNHYNFIHYRYENDFKHHFKLVNKSLDEIVEKIKFKKNDLPMFIALNKDHLTSHLCSDDLKTLLFTNNSNTMQIVTKYQWKHSEIFDELNFEENAFIDLMIGYDSCELYGHRNSSFSVLLNNHFKTDNYYS